MSQKKDVIRKRGGRFGFWFFHVSLRIFGLSGAYGLLYIVCLYYLLFDRAAVSAAMAYIEKRFRGYNRFQRMLCVYKLFINQGKNLIDRYYLISGHGEFDIEFYGHDDIKTNSDVPQEGFILLTTHVGNWQVVMTALERFGRTVHLLMLPEENIAVKESLNIDGETGRVRIISAEDPIGSIVKVMKVIEDGDIVSIMGDRIHGNNFTEVDFLGEKAKFPHGAFTLAAASKCPVVMALSANISKKKYILDVSHVIEPHYSSRRKRHEDIKGYVQEFAKILEDYVTKHPFQWFVFRDIWVKPRKRSWMHTHDASS